MNNIREKLTNIFKEAFESAGYGGEYGVVTASDRPDLCRFQCNGALAAAKQYKKNPMAIAEDVAQRAAMLSSELSIQVAKPGFININVSGEMLAERVNAMLRDPRCLLPAAAEPKTIVLDYGGPNVAKALHIGHLRPAIIGDTLYRIGRFLGHSVISDVHLGDFGLPMGLVIAALIERGLDVRKLSPDELNEIYPAASARSKDDPEFRAEAQRITRELQQGDTFYREIWEEIRRVSSDDAKCNYDDLNLLEFDYWYGESDSHKCVPEVLEKLTERGLLIEDGGAQVVHVKREDDREPMPPLIITKTGGGEVYVTADLATILQREYDFKPDEIWYFTDARQNLYFKQVFRCAEMGGLTRAKFSHTGFGTVNGRDGKPLKTRSGGVMKLADMIAEVREKLPDHRIACAAIRIADLQNQPIKDYQFDLEKFTSAEGKTGPYLLYTAVRIDSILAKTPEGSDAMAVLAPASDNESAVMLALDAAGEALLRAFEEKSPNALCDALFDIAAKLNTFYAEQRILAHPDEVRRNSWLALITLTRRMLGILLDLLGVEIPESM